ncbi:MAG: hypothetical protein AAFY08_07560, partial [Planctomycetota bacterium]
APNADATQGNDPNAANADSNNPAPNANTPADGQSGDNGLATTPDAANRLTPTRTEALVAAPTQDDPALIADIADLPPTYRDEAAAYFRRLADDAANRRNPD